MRKTTLILALDAKFVAEYWVEHKKKNIFVREIVK